MFLVEKKILGLLSYFVEDKSVFLYSLFSLAVWDHKTLIHPGLNTHFEECETLLWKVIIPYFSFSFWIFQVIGHCVDGKWGFQWKGPYNSIFSWFRGDSQSLIWPDVSNSNHLQFYVVTPAHTGSIAINYFKLCRRHLSTHASTGKASTNYLKWLI